MFKKIFLKNFFRLHEQSEMSKIVDTLDLGEPKTLEQDENNKVRLKNEDKVLTQEFMQELGLEPGAEDRKAFDCDISALNAME